jgi:hypothetical protein
MKSFLSILSFGLLAATSSSFAATATVNCPAQSINAAITSFFSPNGTTPRWEKLTLRVSGTCTENVQILPFREVELVANGTATLQPQFALQPVLHVQGRGLIRGFRVRSAKPTGFPEGLIQVGAYGFLRIEFADIQSTTATVLVQTYHTSTVEIRNSLIAGGTDSAVQTTNNSHAFIYAEGEGTTRIRNAASDAISCYQGSLIVWAIGASSKVIIGPSERGISSENCTARIGGFDEDAGLVHIIGATDAAINADSGDSYTLYQTRLAGNPGAAVELTNGTMRIGTSAIGNNGSGLHSDSGATIDFQNDYGPSNVFQSAYPYNCYQGGRIYADPGDITGASEYCLQVGEPD